MVESSMNESEAKQNRWWQRVLVFVGVPIISFAAIFAGRIVWEETWLTLQQGPLCKEPARGRPDDVCRS
jgi:hypothetical protein